MMAEELARKLADMENVGTSNTRRIQQLERRQDNLDQLTAALAGQQKDIEHINSDVKEIKGDVKALMALPGGRWNALVTTTATGAAGALVGAVMALILR